MALACGLLIEDRDTVLEFGLRIGKSITALGGCEETSGKARAICDIEVSLWLGPNGGTEDKPYESEHDTR